MKSDKFKSKLVTVALTKSAQFSPVIVVPEHELPILELIHGEGTVNVIPNTKSTKKHGAGTVREYEHDRERERLVKKYRAKKGQQHPVELIYGPKLRSTLGQDELPSRRTARRGADEDKTGTDE